MLPCRLRLAKLNEDMKEDGGNPGKAILDLSTVVNQFMYQQVQLIYIMSQLAIYNDNNLLHTVKVESFQRVVDIKHLYIENHEIWHGELQMFAVF